jgi:hypothetical protein
MPSAARAASEVEAPERTFGSAFGVCFRRSDFESTMTGPPDRTGGAIPPRERAASTTGSANDFRVGEQNPCDFV